MLSEEWSTGGESRNEGETIWEAIAGLGGRGWWLRPGVTEEMGRSE